MSPRRSRAGTASGASPASGVSSSRSSTRSAAAALACSSLRRLAASRMGPENFREYRTKEDRLPSVRAPLKYIRAPNMLIAARDTLLIKLTEGPRAALARSAS